MSLRTPVLIFGWVLALLASTGVSVAVAATLERDPSLLELASVKAMVVDTRSNKILYSQNPDTVVPIASISKLMTAMVVLDSGQSLDERISVQVDQAPIMNNVISRLRIGSVISRRDMLQMALMSSENRAAASLAHHYVGGYEAFIDAMNAKAEALGMSNSHFVEPTGLSENNVSTARDLMLLTQAAAGYPLITELSTAPKKDMRFRKPVYTLAFYNTNPLVRNEEWNIQLTKTGFINEAGHCLVMLARINDQPLAMVLLDSFGKRSHVGDAGRIRRWLETGNASQVPAAAKAYRERKTGEISQQQPS